MRRLTMRRLLLCAAFAVAVMPAMAQRCQGLLEAKATASSAAQAIYKALLQTDVACGSINVILDRTLNRKRSGGRRLESDRPFDEAQAQSNLDAALRDPAVKARIEQGRKVITEETALLAFEAAVLDEEGFYGARDLRVQQLQQRVN